MGKTVLAALDKEIMTTYKEMQYGYGFRRILSEESESVTYLPGSIFRLWINQEALSYSLHWHPAAEMIIPLENDYYVTMNNVHYTLHPGDIFIIPPCELHSIDAPPTGHRLLLLFDFGEFESIHNFSMIQSYFSGPVLINAELNPALYRQECELISLICKDYFGEDSLRDTAISARLLTFFVNYARYSSSVIELNGYSRSNRTKQRELEKCFSMVYDYIDAHICDDLTLETVAKVACFSKYHFSRIFKEYSGLSFYDYVRKQKVKHAAELLLQPELPIINIALQTGFANLTTFNRTFKAVNGCTPTAYRKLFDEDAR